jgi:flagellar hook-associated protein FlgK
VQGSTTHTLITTVDTSNNNFRNAQWADGQPFNPTAGEMTGIFDARDNVIKGEKTKLNNLAASVFTSVNQIHEKGYGLDDPVPSATSGSSPVGYPAYPYASGSANPLGRDFFVVNGDPGWSSGWTASGSMSASGSYTPPSMINIAQTISINTALDNVRNISVAQDPHVSGDGRNAEALFLLQTNKTNLMQVNNSYVPGVPASGSPFTALLDPVSGSPISDNLDNYNSQRVTELGLTIQKSDTMSTQHKNLLDVLTKDRESVNGVSLDEEAANLIKYQRSYQASIRMMTAVDDMLNRVINNMGVT